MLNITCGFVFGLFSLLQWSICLVLAESAFGYDRLWEAQVSSLGLEAPSWYDPSWAAFSFSVFQIVTSFCACSVAQSCLTLCDPMDCSPPDFIHGISQASILEWVAISYSRESFWPRDQTHISCISCIGKRILYHCVAWIALVPPYLPSFLGHVLALQEAFPCLSACPNPNSEFKSSPGLTPPMEHAHVRMLSHFSGVWLFVTLWTVARQAPLSLRFSR